MFFSLRSPNRLSTKSEKKQLIINQLNHNTTYTSRKRGSFYPIKKIIAYLCGTNTILMKKTLLILFLAVASLTACKKDEESSNKLEGRWDFVSGYAVVKENGVIISEKTKEPEEGGEALIFEGNKFRLLEAEKTESTGTFSTTENTINFKFDDDSDVTLPLKWNSSTEIVITTEETYTQEGKNYQDKEERTYKKR